MEVGATLSAKLEYTDVDSASDDIDISYKWLDEHGNELGTGEDYVLQNSDVGKQIHVEAVLDDGGTGATFKDVADVGNNHHDTVHNSPLLSGFVQYNTEEVLNGGFEEGSAHWSNRIHQGKIEIQSAEGNSPTWGTAHSGNFVELDSVDGKSGRIGNTLTQEVTFEEGATTATLAFYYKERVSGSGIFDGKQKFSVFLNGHKVNDKYIHCGDEWSQFVATIDFAEYDIDGGSAILEFREYDRGSCGILLDDISVASHPAGAEGSATSTVYYDDSFGSHVVATAAPLNDADDLAFSLVDKNGNELSADDTSYSIDAATGQIQLAEGAHATDETLHIKVTDTATQHSVTHDLHVTTEPINEVHSPVSDGSMDILNGTTDAADRFIIAENSDEITIKGFDASDGDTLNISSVLDVSGGHVDLTASNFDDYVTVTQDHVSQDHVNYTVTVHPDSAHSQVITFESPEGIEDQMALIQMIIQNN
nr:type I secretion C-terminal target domain-containing protein [Halodesulfovibrio marinisediminis]